MANLGLLQPGTSGQVFQASGESTPSAKLPEKFVSTAQADSPIASQLAVPSGFETTGNTPIVQRAPRMIGMRYLYQRGMQRIPIKRLGADGQPYPFTSAFQPNAEQKIANAGFNDALYQAGYPGINLGLSFKVPTLPQNQPGGRGYGSSARPAAYTPININVSAAVNRLRRSNGAPPER